MFFATPGFLTPTPTPTVSYLLDTYPGAAAAYSVRKLSSTYTGSSLRVRRSSDNAEQDIGFVGEDLDKASIITFVGAGNGFVTTWYDQSGNSRNAAQASASVQPAIISSGSVQLENSKPIMIGNTGTIQLTTNIPLSSGNQTQLSVSRHEGVINTSGYVMSNFDGFSPNRSQLISSNGSASAPYLPPPPSNSFLNGSSFTFTTRDVAYDKLITQSLVTLNWTSSGFTSMSIIGSGYATFSMQSMQEFILYDADKLTDRASIEANINTYYSIF